MARLNRIFNFPFGVFRFMHDVSVSREQGEGIVLACRVRVPYVRGFHPCADLDGLREEVFYGRGF